MQQVSVSKPSDFPRDEKFRDPTTPPFCDENGVYHVFSMADVMQVLVNREAAFTRDPSPWLPDEGPLHMALNFMWMIEPFTLDGEEGRHDPLRRVVEPWFKNRAVRTMQPIIRELTVEMINEIVSKGTGELNLATELSSRLSMRVICRLTGIELEREHWMRKKLDEFNQAPWSDLPLQWEVQAYFWQMVAKRTARPQDELLDVIVGAWKTGVIDDDELLGYIYGFMAAGTDTTGASLVNAFALLAEFDLLDYTRGVLDDDGAMRRLVEEILRFGTPFPMKPLYVRKDSRFGELDDLVHGSEPRRSRQRRGAGSRPERVRSAALAEQAHRARLGKAPLPRRRARAARDPDLDRGGAAAAARPANGREQAVQPLRRSCRQRDRSLLHLRSRARRADQACRPRGRTARLTSG